MEASTAISEYRALLTKLEQEAQSTFDKTVLTLSGGALGLSFAFTKDVVGVHNVIHTNFLLAAWTGWGLSATSVLVSFFTSHLALRKAISQLDEGKFATDSEKMERPGGWYDGLTKWLNGAGLALFLCGLTAMMCFLFCNLKDHMNEPQRTANGQLVPPVPADAQIAIHAGQLVPAPPVSLVVSKETPPPVQVAPTPSHPVDQAPPSPLPNATNKPK